MKAYAKIWSINRTQPIPHIQCIILHIFWLLSRTWYHFPVCWNNANTWSCMLCLDTIAFAICLPSKHISSVIKSFYVLTDGFGLYRICTNDTALVQSSPMNLSYLTCHTRQARFPSRVFDLSRLWSAAPDTAKVLVQYIDQIPKERVEIF